MIRETIKEYRDRILGRNVAYNRVFDKKSPYVDIVLKDLAKFCRAYDSTFDPDPRKHALQEGRREVWLRIVENLELSIDEIYRLHVVKEIHPKEDHS